MQGNDQQRREAFEAEMLPHLDAAYRLARALTRHEQDAEDVVQEAYLRAFAGFAGYTPGTHARAWLLTIVRRLYLNGRRHERRKSQMVPMDLNLESSTLIDPTAPQPEAEALRRLGDRQVLSVLAELPEAFRSVLALVDLDGMHYSEAAEILGCPLGTVMSRLHRGRLELARRLQATETKREVGWWAIEE